MLSVKPVLAPSPEVFEELAGRDVTLPCIVSHGFPPPLIVWTKSGRTLLSRDGPRDEGQRGGPAEEGVAGEVFDLVISNVTVGEGGEYVCTASNMAGQASSSILLKVFGGQTVFV